MEKVPTHFFHPILDQKRDKQVLGCNFPVFKYLSSYSPKSTMDAVEPFKGVPFPSMIC